MTYIRVSKKKIFKTKLEKRGEKTKKIKTSKEFDRKVK